MARRLSNILLLIIALVLGSYLTHQNLKPKPVTVENYVDYWDVTTHQLNRSRWEPNSGPPPMSQSQAMATGRKIIDYIGQHKNEIELKDFQIESLGLVRLGSETSWWAYQFIMSASREGKRNWYQFSILLLMDGKIAVDPSYQSSALMDAVKEFGATEGVEIIWADE